MKFTVRDIKDWSELAFKIKPLLQHNILLLKGNLGAGKTTFTQNLIKSLGSSDPVSSPTYSIVNEYKTEKGTVFHFDLYRMNSIEEVYDIGMDEYLENSYLCIIEWPEIYEDELVGIPFHTMSIENLDNTRNIIFE